MNQLKQYLQHSTVWKKKETSQYEDAKKKKKKKTIVTANTISDRPV